jgi:Putative zinc-finger
MLHCPDTLLEWYALNQLSERETAFVETHYLACGECAAKTEEMVEFVATIRSVLRPDGRVPGVEKSLDAAR